MSELHVAQIRRHLEEKYLPHLDLTGLDQEALRLSRAVTALAISERTGLPEKAAAECVTDHRADGGIDGIGYALDRATLVVVRGSWTSDGDSGVDNRDVLEFMKGVHNLIEREWGGFTGGIRRRRTEIEDMLFWPGTRLEMVIATSGTARLAEQQRKALAAFCAQINDATEIASYLHLNQEQLHASVAASRNARMELSVNLASWTSEPDPGAVLDTPFAEPDLDFTAPYPPEGAGLRDWVLKAGRRGRHGARAFRGKTAKVFGQQQC